MSEATEIDRAEAYKCFAAGDFAKAHELLRAVYERDFGDAQSANDLAVVLFKLGRLQDAVARFREAQLLSGEAGSLLVQNIIDSLDQLSQRGALSGGAGVVPCPSFDGDFIRFANITVEMCTGDALRSRESSADCFVLGKTRRMVEDLVSKLAYVPARIVELGVWKGGGVVLLNELFTPNRLVAIDFNPVISKHVEDYAARSGGAVRLRLGVDQSDESALKEIHKEDFDGLPLDLVIDDASHHYEESKASFECLFPLLRPDGVYVIEDWGWAHWPGEHWQTNSGGDYFRGKRSLGNLVVRLALLAASQPQLLSEVSIGPICTFVRRGPAECVGRMDIDAMVLNRGNPVPYID